MGLHLDFAGALRRALTIPRALRASLAAKADAEIDTLFSGNSIGTVDTAIKAWVTHSLPGGALLVLVAGSEIDSILAGASGDVEKAKSALKSAINRAIGA